MKEFAPPPSFQDVYCKREEFAPWGSKFFPFRVDILLEGVLSFSSRPFFRRETKKFWELSPQKVAFPLKYTESITDWVIGVLSTSGG